MRTVLDFETRSVADLKKVGAYQYSKHPSTRATCLAFKSPGDVKPILIPFELANIQWSDLPGAHRKIWEKRARGIVVAHNAFFERCIYQNILVERLGWPEIPTTSWRCTAARAAACALPRALDRVGEVLKLSTQKDKGGMIAMMRTCRPSREWNAWNKKRNGTEPELFISPESHPEVFRDLYHYCLIDVLTEELLDQQLPELSEFELEIWRINQEMNWNGFRVDLPLVRKIVTILEPNPR
jgi:DNA polymerase